ncbi:MAG: imelysin family protein [Ekhidna sp.]|nr:imelysin family protein [Ekhidna sp.]
MRSYLNKYLVYCFSLVTVAFMIACGEDDDSVEEEVGFDRAEMLTSLADGLIIPNFQALQRSANDLSEAVASFNANSSVDNLTILRESWLIAVEDFQHCSAFGFGPANFFGRSFASLIGVFPVNESAVESNIIDPDFNLAASFATDVRGLYTIEYLIYGTGEADEKIAPSFDEERKAYLSLISNEIRDRVDEIVDAWTTSYRADFIASTGTSAGSSTSLLYNEFVKDYENLKNFKVELPAGLTAGQQGADPTLVEAFYSGISKELIEEHFQSSVNLWSGTSRTGDELIGFEEYLDSVVGGPELVTTTKDAIGELEAALQNLPEGELANIIDRSEIQELRDKLQGNTANFKSSMSSLLGISITFNSGDGD